MKLRIDYYNSFSLYCQLFEYSYGTWKSYTSYISVLLLSIAIVSVNGYLTYKTFNDLSSDETADMVSNPQFEVSGADSEIVTTSVLVDLPIPGFIQKGIDIKSIMNYSKNV